MTKPVLSIGIIFKNEIRCLERCLKSLDPLRQAVPCELVMADTGSDDGSRQIAEKYADLLIEFPWTNDFAAARNAVMDRCSGKWFLTIDCDEWLDQDINRLVEFLTSEEGYDFASLIVRNYKSLELEKGGMFSDFAACRILRMSTGTRYEGAIHEHWNYETDGTWRILMLSHTILHHDGYVFIDEESNQKKIERNMSLLRAELEKEPNSLLLLMQCIESDANSSPAYMDYINRAVEGVKQKHAGWDMFGPSILRHAVLAATVRKLPEIEDWIALSEALFPTSIFTTIDVAYLALGHYWNKDDYTQCIRYGEEYFLALQGFDSGNFDQKDIVSSPVSMISPYWRQDASLYLAAAYLFEHRPDRSVELLNGLDATIMDIKQIGNVVRNLAHLQSHTELNTAPILTSFWDSMVQPEPSKEKALMRRYEFQRMGANVFEPDYQDAEQNEVDFCRHAYTLFLPLVGKCPLASAAVALEARDSVAIAAALSAEDCLEEIPACVLIDALERGVYLPLPDRPMKIEQMDSLAARLSSNKDRFFPIVLRVAKQVSPDDWQRFCWVRGLILAAIRTYPWNDKDQNMELGMEIARSFVKLEGDFLPRCYVPEMLTQDSLFALPPLHRFGWYCTQAFNALEQRGDAVEYVRLLRAGLDTCEGVKDMVEFLANHTAEVQQLMTPPELKVLADQVRVILARFAPDDPAVAALKQSEAYQKVAHLIEGMAVPLWGGLVQ